MPTVTLPLHFPLHLRIYATFRFTLRGTFPDTFTLIRLQLLDSLQALGYSVCVTRLLIYRVVADLF